MGIGPDGRVYSVGQTQVKVSGNIGVVVMQVGKRVNDGKGGAGDRVVVREEPDATWIPPFDAPRAPQVVEGVGFQPKAVLAYPETNNMTEEQLLQLVNEYKRTIGGDITPAGIRALLGDNLSSGCGPRDVAAPA